MLDQDHELVLRVPRGGEALEDCTRAVESCATDGTTVRIQFRTSAQVHEYPHPQARLLKRTQHFELRACDFISVDGLPGATPATVSIFADPLEPPFEWVRIVRNGGGQPREATYDARRVTFYRSADDGGTPDSVCDYIRTSVAHLSADHPLRRLFGQVIFIHPDSALAAYIQGRCAHTTFPNIPVILPFASNPEQADAVTQALRNQICVIDGPPGTGKTETIANLIANIVSVPGRTVGVVSSSTDDVYARLDAAGLGFVAARLGTVDRVAQFLRDQHARSEAVSQWLHPLPALDVVTSSADLGDAVEKAAGDLEEAWQVTREHARVRNAVEAYRLELAHFEHRTPPDQLPALGSIPLLKKRSSRILDFLAEHAVSPTTSTGLVQRLGRQLRFGKVTDLDLSDGGTVAKLKHVFYQRRLAELEARGAKLARKTVKADKARARHRELSSAVLRRALVERYANRPRAHFDSGSRSFRRRMQEFHAEYPVVLTTAESIRDNLPDGTLLDWVIIDEATHTNILTAALAMSRARNVVVIGDLRQLGHITGLELPGAVATPPKHAYDLAEHSIASSMRELYGEQLPGTRLREHFRSPRVIAEFASQLFYRGRLIPLQPSPKRPALEQHHVSLVPGAGDPDASVTDQLLATLSATVATGGDPRMGVTTPYRLEINPLSGTLPEQPDAQCRQWLNATAPTHLGRQVDTMVLSAVVDEATASTYGLRFVDEPALVAQALTQATQRFVLLTERDRPPKPQVLRALSDYIRYQDPARLDQGNTTTVLERLHREFSERMYAHLHQVDAEHRYVTEMVTWQMLKELFRDPRYRGYHATAQVAWKDLIPGFASLLEEQQEFIHVAAPLDFVIYHRASFKAVLAVEVSNSGLHRRSDHPLAGRGDLKRTVLRSCGVELLRLPTGGPEGIAGIRQALEWIRTAP